MNNRYTHETKSGYGTVSNDNGQLELIPAIGTNQYLYLENVNFSVVEAAQGGGGVMELKDSLGNLVYAMNVDGIKDISLNFGSEGVRLPVGCGVMFVVSGAATKQATVSCAIKAHIDYR